MKLMAFTRRWSLLYPNALKQHLDEVPRASDWRDARYDASLMSTRIAQCRSAAPSSNARLDPAASANTIRDPYEVLSS